MHELITSPLGKSAILALFASLAGCGEEADRPSDVHTLRVLAVRSETPFAKPGATAELSMLAFDGSPRARRADGTPRATSTLWIGGCVNPAGDNYAACMPYLHQVVSQLGDENLATGGVPSDTPAGIVGWGQNFTAQIPADIIASRQVASSVVYPYGVEMLFFAHCGGMLRRLSVPATSFPLGCFDAETGAELGRDDFDYGFFPLFVYESLDNQNPILKSVSFEDNPLGARCSETEPCSSGFHCGSSGVCIPVVVRCKQADAKDCPSYTLSIEVPRASVERAATAHVTEADALAESLWVSYFANAGSFEQDARIINDPHSGWGEGIDGKWRARVANSQQVRLWAVVRDDRNGVAWDWRDLWVE
jgi:hypothetical protein